MKIGLIVESGPQGADLQVLQHLVEQLVPGAALSSVTFRNKPDLLANCGDAVSRLLAERCDLIVIVWDLYPAWREDGSNPDCVQDSQDAWASIAASGYENDSRIKLICICEELEAWLVSDGRALSAVLSRPSHPVRVTDTKRPDLCDSPKTALRRLFRENGHGDYTDRTHAIRIIRAMPDHTRIRKSQSFRRLVDKLTTS